MRFWYDSFIEVGIVDIAIVSCLIVFLIGFCIIIHFIDKRLSKLERKKQ